MSAATSADTGQGGAPAVYLVTGAMGCIGAWILHHLVAQGQRVISFDLSDQRHRLDLLMDREQQEAVTFVQGDLTDTQQVAAALENFGVTHVIHLAALQVPFCRANPVLGAQVNVVGTANIFEAVRQAGLKHVVYASSVAVYGPPEPAQRDAVLSDAPYNPATLYGVYKVANEGAARVYWQENGITSTALRPYTVYGVGRDQGFTSDPTKAMLAAAAGKPFHIQFNGPCQYHYASDVALQFIAAAENPLTGAFAFNMGGAPVTSSKIAEIINSFCPDAHITWADTRLPFPAGFDDLELCQAFPQVYQTPLEEGVRQTIEQFRSLLEAGRIQME
jgi:nucleoside-diphosphate-sugar epimerase